MRLRGRRVLITGASSGVGAAAVALFAREGARLALISRSGNSLRTVAERHAPDALALSVDLTDRGATERALERVCDELGGLDVVITNHAAAVFGHLLEVHADDFQRTIDVTFGGAVNVIRAALPELRRSRGAIVATGSVSTRVPLPTWSSYAAAKHALRGFLNSLRIEEREQRTGVSVSMLHPGPIDTPLWAQSSSATGLRPRVPPDAHSAETIAKALVELVVKPRNEVVLGGGTRLLDMTFAVARPLAEAVLLMIDRWYHSGDEEAPAPGSLWQAVTVPQTSGGIPSRASILAPLQLGRRMMPEMRTPWRLVRNFGFAGVRAAQLTPNLMRPVQERQPPADSIRHRRTRRDAQEHVTV